MAAIREPAAEAAAEASGLQKLLGKPPGWLDMVELQGGHCATMLATKWEVHEAPVEMSEILAKKKRGCQVVEVPSTAVEAKAAPRDFASALISVTARTLGHELRVRIASAATVHELKDLLAIAIGVLHPFGMKLLLGTTVLEDDWILEEHGVGSGTEVTIIVLADQIPFSDLTFDCPLDEFGGVPGSVHRALMNDEKVVIERMYCASDQFESLVALVRCLKHPRVVRFVGACREPQNLCIVTEYMPGGSLQGLLKVAWPLTSGQQMKIALQVSEGVAALHDRAPPVVHGALMPSNIALDSCCNAKICGFSSARPMGGTRLTTEGGYLRILAPECYDSKGKITEKLDVWCMGSILVQIFGGPAPYDDCDNIEQIISKVLIDKQMPYIPCDLPPGVQPIIKDCFHFDIEKRPTALDVFQRLIMTTPKCPR